MRVGMSMLGSVNLGSSEVDSSSPRALQTPFVPVQHPPIMDGY